MNKRGISPLIATVLLIGATIALAALVMIWSQNLFKSTTESTGKGIEAEMVCASDVQFNIDRAIGIAGSTVVTITNSADIQIEEFIARVHKDDETIQVVTGVKASDGSGLGPYNTKSYTITYDVEGDGVATKIELVPKIKLDDGSPKTCGQNIEKVTPSPSSS